MVRRILCIDLLFVVYVLILGLVFVFWVPPFQKPDEVAHFLTVAEVAHGGDLKIEGRYLNLPERYLALKLAHRDEEKFPPKLLWQKDVNRTAVEYKNLATERGWISYFPAVLGFWLGNFSDYPVVALWGARLGGLVFFLIAVMWSLKIVGRNYRPIVWIYAGLPMVLHQVTCVSYDMMQLILTPIIFAYFVRVVGNMAKRWEWVVLGVLAGLFLLVKGGYYGLLGLLGVALLTRIEGIFKRYPVLYSIPPQLLLGATVLGFWIFGHYFGFWRLVPFDLVNPVYQYQLTADDPVYLIKVLINSWNEKWEFVFRSTMGYFGWLDYQYNLYTLLWVAVVVIWGLRELVKRNERPALAIHPLLWLWGVIIGQVVMLMVMFYFNWTDVGAKVIEGIQGRYLLPLAPFVIFGGLEVWLWLGKERARDLLLASAMVIVLVNSFRIISKRYYDFSESFWNKEALAKDLEEARGRKEKIETLSSKEAMRKYFDTSDRDEMGGFQVAITRGWGGVKVPYKYRLMDEECRWTIRSGYFEQKKLQEGEIYQQTFKSFKTRGRVICLEIKPAVGDIGGWHFDYLMVGGETQIRPLFVKRE